MTKAAINTNENGK